MLCSHVHASMAMLLQDWMCTRTPAWPQGHDAVAGLVVYSHASMATGAQCCGKA
jgi:hypothetical protein